MANISNFEKEKKKKHIVDCDINKRQWSTRTQAHANIWDSMRTIVFLLFIFRCVVDFLLFFIDSLLFSQFSSSDTAIFDDVVNIILNFFFNVFFCFHFSTIHRRYKACVKTQGFEHTLFFPFNWIYSLLSGFFLIFFFYKLKCV